ncbi:diacylglycerol kinase catalytic domain protein [Bifidobacterium actinocoloniiforme DSM 22766]|uniref:Diacylglycerol kinase catalytic domain protein n=1 Tax=Bifidobacterium actinocoloniiforme DSM 22766 TaxID=1437605 RepID=A0A086Z1U1_9BIFI|nr:diacylglycerol kinase family protein [Bifidobacterium actinocoloniiforme]KFI40491.1 diacylglycerol kinase catalytic domain protein [Bifidobacterium actinocoloniiforme DSM 22766]
MPLSAIVVLAGVVCVIAALAALALWLRARARRRLEASLQARHDDGDRVSYAFVINPSKPQAEQARGLIKDFCGAKGLDDVRFYDTQLDKDGKACALQAVDEGADIVVAVGGDGTVRTVASAVASTGHTLGIVPIGTGNLFARNLNIPVGDMDAALAVATSHGSRLVDVGRMRILDSSSPQTKHAFLIIAGIGFDAMMIDDTDPNLKKSISWLAYFISGAKHLFADKYHGDVTIRQPDGRSQTNKDVEFRTFMAGNCGEIPGFSLMPDASFDDGILDFELIDTSGGLIGWANLFGDVMHQTITRKPNQSPLSTNSSIVQVQGSSASIRLKEPALAQVDGDILGQTQHIELTVDHQALCVRVPVD